MKCFKRLLICCLLVASLILTFSGCGSEDTGIPDEYSVKVTYYLDGGTIESYEKQTSIVVYYKPDSLIAQPGESSPQFKQATKKGYSIEGWYVSQVNDKGEVTTDDNGNPIASDQKFDFLQTKVSEDLTLVAVWGRSIRVVFDNLHHSKAKLQTCLTKDCKINQTVTKPAYTKSYETNSDNKVEEWGIAGYYWSYDADTDTYSDEISWPIDYATLDEKINALGDDIEESDGFVLFHIYTKLSAPTD
jgi:hypothetical protein